MEFNRWWAEDPDERFWLEITDRKVIGVDLRAPRTGQDGRPKWQYSLINEIRPGDIVFHYADLAGEPAGICGWSRAVGEVWEEPVGRGSQPAGWRRSLEGYFPLDDGVITLDAIRGRDADIRRIEADLRQRFGRPTYAPFETGARPIHPSPAYLTKLPRALVTLFPATAAVAELDPTEASPVPTEAHRTYRRINEHALTSRRDPFAVDPSLVERGLEVHARVQNELADYLEWHGIRPLSPAPSEPNFDLAFAVGETLTVVEVTCLSSSDAERQLQLGLGRVLGCAQRMRTGGSEVVPALALDRPAPADWLELAARVDVIVAWPGEWSRLL